MKLTTCCSLGPQSTHRSSRRALLRLPPFPLARLRAAFADPPGYVEPPAGGAGGASADTDPEPEAAAASRSGAVPSLGEAPTANGASHPEGSVAAPPGSGVRPGAPHALHGNAAADPSSGDSLSGRGDGASALATGTAAAASAAAGAEEGGADPAAAASGRFAEPSAAPAGGPGAGAAGEPGGPAAAASPGREGLEASMRGAAEGGNPALLLDERGGPQADGRLQHARAGAQQGVAEGGPGEAQPALNAEARSAPAGEHAHAAAVALEDVATGGFALGAEGQSVLLRDVHAALLRMLEGLDDNVEEAPTLAGYGAAADLAPQDVYRCRPFSNQPVPFAALAGWRPEW